MSQLTSISYIKQIMQQNGVAFSKSLGQNFLIDENIVVKIAQGADIGSEDGILEIGPGIGSLTEQLLKRVKKVISIEIDKALWPILEQHFAGAQHFELIKGDVLKLDLKTLIREKFADCQNVKVVANLPYYITTPIIMKFLEEKIDVSDIVVMVQREVAERMTAKQGGKIYGSLSVAVQFYAESMLLFKVPKGVFIPQPKVDSAVIRLKIRHADNLNLLSDETFFKVVKAAFAQRRKTLLNTLSSNLNMSKDEVKKVCQNVFIDPSDRAERLSIEDFGKLANTVHRHLQEYNNHCNDFFI